MSFFYVFFQKNRKFPISGEEVIFLIFLWYKIFIFYTRVYRKNAFFSAKKVCVFLFFSIFLTKKWKNFDKIFKKTFFFSISSKYKFFVFFFTFFQKKYPFFYAAIWNFFSVLQKTTFLHVICPAEKFFYFFWKMWKNYFHFVSFHIPAEKK